jgi:hypothetical protein
MPCTSTSASASAFTSSQFALPLTASTFETTGQIAITQLTLDKIFVELAKSIPFVSSNANSYITSLVSKTFEPNFKPTYFQIPYIYSACDNLVNGIYKESSSLEDNIIIIVNDLDKVKNIKETLNKLFIAKNSDKKTLEKMLRLDNSIVEFIRNYSNTLFNKKIQIIKKICPEYTCIKNMSNIVLSEDIKDKIYNYANKFFSSNK